MRSKKREIVLQEAIQAEKSVRTLDQEKNLEDSVKRHEQQELLRLEQLPALYRIILILRNSQEVSWQEVARKLALPICTIKTHLFRAGHLLKQRVLAFTREHQA